MEPITRLTRDLAKASVTLSTEEARFLVDSYYSMQDDRIRGDNQVKALSGSNEPHEVLRWLADQSGTLETQIKRALAKYAEGHPVGQWLLSVHGIGPVIAAGLLAHIDITKAPTAGHIWRFAGLDPTSKWSKGEKRPWNAKLKVLCWKASESFVKVSGSDKDVYGHLYLKRKAYELAKNAAGDYAEQATAALVAKRMGKDTDAVVWYSGQLTAADSGTFYGAPSEKRVGLAKKLAAANAASGTAGVPMLPPGHIHARAERWTVKLFLAHLHEVWYRQEYGEAPPLPYPIAILGHAHYLAPDIAAAQCEGTKI